MLYHRIAAPRLDTALLDVSPERLAAHLEILGAEATIVPLDEFEDRRRAGTLPARAVAITFDDGYADNLHVAAPIIERHRASATVFVATGIVGARGEFWWDDAERVAATPLTLGVPAPVPGVPWNGEDGRGPVAEPWNLTCSGARSARESLLAGLSAMLHDMEPAARDAAVASLRAWAGVPDTARPDRRGLTQDELVRLARTPGIAIGAHTVTHPCLARLPFEAQLAELRGSRAALEAMIGRPVTALAYPFGTRADVSRDTLRAARQAGFEYACANEPGVAWRWSSRWSIPRVIVRDWSGAEFRQRLEAWWKRA